MAAADQVGIVFHEERQDQHPDVHSVVVGIRGHDNVVVAEVVKAQFNSADERLLYRFYDSRLVYRGMMKALARIYAILGVNH